MARIIVVNALGSAVKDELPPRRIVVNHRLDLSRHLFDVELSVGESFRIGDHVMTLLGTHDGESRFLIERIDGDDFDDDSFDAAEFELPASLR